MQRDSITDNTKNTKGSYEIQNTKKARPKGRAYLVEIVAPLLTPNLQPHSNQIFPKSLIYN